jgi:hypothetical protein
MSSCTCDDYLNLIILVLIMNDPTGFYTAKLFILFALVLLAAAKEPQPLALETDFGGELQLN